MLFFIELLTLMEAINCLENIIKSEGNSSDEWNALLNILREDMNE
jgi:hypothetical protein